MPKNESTFMQAIVLRQFGGVENFELKEVRKPLNGENSVLVRIKATAFNPIDYQIRQGSGESKLLKSPVLGREFSGVIEKTGKNVKGFSIGDEIVAYAGSLGSNGTYAQYISVPTEIIALKSGNISFQDAAALPIVGMTALQCFERLKINPDNPLFISGAAGGVGTILIKLLVADGLQHIFTTSGNEESKKHLMTLGIKEENIFNYRESDIVASLLKKNNGLPFDFCIDLAGGEMSEVCSSVIKINGIYCDVTNLASGKAKETLFDKGTTIINISNYAYTLTGNHSDISYYGKKLTELIGLINSGKISIPEAAVTGNFGVETVRDSHLILETNLTKGKKLVMTMD